jgi:hypothetical protein
MTALPPTATATPRGDYLTGAEAALILPPAAPISAGGVVSDVITLPTPTVTAVTATTMVTAVEQVDLLPGSTDVPLTEVLFRVGDLPPGGRVVMLIETLVLSDAVAGTVYNNDATFAAVNMDPGVSNRVSVEVVSDQPLFLLPVTGGLLDLVDPRTPQGRVSWMVILVVAAAGGWLWWRRRSRRS